MIHELATWCAKYVMDLAVIMAFMALLSVLISVIVGTVLYLKDMWTGE